MQQTNAVDISLGDVKISVCILVGLGHIWFLFQQLFIKHPTRAPDCQHLFRNVQFCVEPMLLLFSVLQLFSLEKGKLQAEGVTEHPVVFLFFTDVRSSFGNFLLVCSKILFTEVSDITHYCGSVYFQHEAGDFTDTLVSSVLVSCLESLEVTCGPTLQASSKEFLFLEKILNTLKLCSLILCSFCLC